jgi:hypothetical protein
MVPWSALEQTRGATEIVKSGLWVRVEGSERLLMEEMDYNLLILRSRDEMRELFRKHLFPERAMSSEAATSASRTLPWLASGWEGRDRRLSIRQEILIRGACFYRVTYEL